MHVIYQCLFITEDTFDLYCSPIGTGFPFVKRSISKMSPETDTQEGSKYCLKWDGFHSNLTSICETMRQDEELVDITLCCDGQKLKAHKMMLSAASPFFRDLLQVGYHALHLQ